MVKPNGLSKRSKKAAAARPPAPFLEAEAKDTERRILDAARKEFIAKGLDGARMQAIASAAGVNKALLHYYHRSKDRLYRTVILDTLQSVWGRIRGHLQSHQPADGLEPMLRTLVSTYLKTLAANPEFPLFMIREMSTGGAAFQAVLKEAGLPVGDIPARLMAALQAEIKAGAVKPVPPLHLLMNVMGMSLATFLVRPVLERMAPLMGAAVDMGDAFLEARVQSIVDTTLNGIRTRRA